MIGAAGLAGMLARFASAPSIRGRILPRHVFSNPKRFVYHLCL